MRDFEACFGVERWASTEFGGAGLGDPRRTKRLLLLGALAAQNPSGKLTEVCAQSAEDLQGSYRFLSNPHFSTDAISSSVLKATANRCLGAEFVYMPVDGSSLAITDWKDVRGLGIIGTRKKDARGLKVMTGIALLPDGCPMGLASQRFWIRPIQKRKKAVAQKRRLEEKETKYWIDVIKESRAGFSNAGVKAKLWYQLDREGDFWHLMLQVQAHKDWFTVRSHKDRCVREGGHLTTVLAGAPIAGCFELHVPGARGRKERVAWMELRHAKVTLDMKDPWTSERYSIDVTVVSASEIGAPQGEEPLYWRLLTNRPVNDAMEAWQVVFGYSLRWRVEDFHKAWKSGVCNAEDTQLGSAGAIIRWSTILASVAMRIERLKHLARNSPNEPATIELTPKEIEAVIVLRKPKGIPRDYKPTIAEVVLWIAEMGGYTGKRSGGPPGTVVIGRGLEKVEIVVEALRNLLEKL